MFGRPGSFVFVFVLLVEVTGDLAADELGFKSLDFLFISFHKRAFYLIQVYLLLVICLMVLGFALFLSGVSVVSSVFDVRDGLFVRVLLKLF